MCKATHEHVWTKAAAQNWQKKFQDPMATLVFTIGEASPVQFCHPQRSLKSHVHGDDFVVSGEPVDLVWMRNELESELDANTIILGDEPGMSKEVKILNRKLCWHDGVGISYEADQKHAEAMVRETGASNLTFLKIPCQREQGGCARQNRRHCGKDKVWKIGHEGTTTCRTDLEPCRNHSEKSIGSNCQFLVIDRRDIVYCAKELTRHMATPTTTDWEKVVRLGRYLKNRPRV